MPISSAYALPFSSTCTNNIPGDVAIGLAQMDVAVAPGPGANQVTFSFTNGAPSATSSITDIYFDDGTLLGLSSINNVAGVSFTALASPMNLPSGNNCLPPFVVTAGFSADSDPPAQSNGVNPGDQVDIIFDLTGGNVVNVIADLGTGALRVGIHVQGYTSGGSESLVTGPTFVPPAMVAGSLTPIDTTMVLVAGTQSIASWMIPVIVAGIGIGIVVARKF